MAFTESGVTLTSYFALKSDWSPYLQAGGAVAVGNNSYGQLGQYNSTHLSSPIAVVGGAGWLDAAVLRNGLGTTFVSDEGSVYFSGMLNTSGFAGPSPIQNGTLSNWSKISSSPEHSLAIKTDGTLWSWGRNDTGSLGLSDTTDRSSPVQVGTLNNWTQISACGYNNGWFSFAIQSNGTLWAWGSNSFGNLGINTSTSITRSSPVQVGTLSDWYQISGGQFHTMAIKTDGTLWGWGNNSFGQLGTNTSTRSNISSPVQIGIENSWYEVEIGAQYTMSIKTDGTLWAWGNNSFGPLGLSDQTHRSSPVQVGTSSDWRQVTAGQSYSGPTFNYTLAIKTDGTLWSWGYNETSGSLGLSNLTNRSSPVQVGTLSNWSQVFAGAGHSLAIKTDGTLWAWGNNGQGQLGLSNTVSRSSPVQVGILSNWNQLTGRGLNSTAIKTDNTLWVWGFAPRGLAGTNYFSNQNFPRKQFLGSFKKVTTSNTHSYFQDFDNQITQYSIEDIPLIDPTVSWSTYDTGLNHFVGIKTNGTAWSIGNNNFGQLGYDTGIPFKEVQSSVRGSHTIALNTNGTLWAWGANAFGGLGLSDTTRRSSPVQIGTESYWSRVSCGYNHSVAIQSNGTLWAWGLNNFGQLGLNTTNSRSSPVQVGTLSDWAQVSVGAFACSLALKTNGTLWSWGYNPLGQLGLSDTTDRSSPVQVGTSSDWSKIFWGEDYSFAIKTDGTLWSWGQNSGLLGLGDTTSRSSPVQVGVDSNWNTIAPGRSHCIGIKTNGTLWGFGRGVGGVFGFSTSATYSTPIQLGSLSDWAQAACGYSTNGSTYLLNSNGYIWVAGDNSFGQLGLGDLIDRSSFVQLGSLNNWTKISTGTNYTISFLNNANTNIWVAGYNIFGQLGTLDTTNRSTPTQVFTSAVNNVFVITQIGSNTNWTKAIAADYGSMLIDNSYNAFVFGKNDQRQLGLSDAAQRISPVQITYTPVITASMDDRNAWLIDANNNIWQSGADNNNFFGIGSTDRLSPIQIGTLSNWSSINTGEAASFSIKTDGTLWSWGAASEGQLGLNTTTLTNISSPVQMGTLSDWTQIGGGRTHTVAENTIGQLWAWGFNGFGQLGRGDTTNTSSPVQVIGGSSDAPVFKQISGSASNLMLTTQGAIWSCGINSYGQLGHGDRVNKSTPVQIGTLSNWNQVSINALSAAAVKTDGTLWTWGWNANGELGLNDTTDRSSPVQVGSLSDWSQVSTGGTIQTLAIKTDGTLWAWGSGSNGQLGLSSTTSFASPVQVGTESYWAKVSTGGLHTLAIKTDGTLWSWGSNSFGQLGQSNLTNRSSPVQVGILSNWTSISAGITQSVAINSNTLYSWGNNSWGQLGLSDVTHRYTPVQVGALSNWSNINCGFLFTTALKTDGTLWAWGNNSYGGLAQSNQTHRLSPVQIGTLSNWTAINSQGYAAYGSLAINTNGFLWGSGLNTFGSLGQNDVTSRFSPVQIVGRTFGLWNSPMTKSWLYTAAIATDRALYVWGNNSWGQLGLGYFDVTHRSFPTKLGNLSNWTQVTGSVFHTVAINSAGELWSWGNNSWGQLGNYQQMQQRFAAKMEQNNKWKNAACGYHTALAVNSDGSLWGTGDLYGGGVSRLGIPFVSSTRFWTPIGTDTDWAYVAGGYNNHAVKTNGTLWLMGPDSNGSGGLNTSTTFTTPAQVGSLSNWSTLPGTIGKGRYLTAAVKSDGTLWAWGGNDNGQLGQSDTTNRSSPTQVGTLSNWSKVACSYLSTHAIKTDGTLWTWGQNNNGQLGLSDLTNRFSPVQVGTDTDWSKVSTGSSNMFVLKTNGTLWSCGYNINGVLGLNTSGNRSSLVQIGTLSNWSEIGEFSGNATAIKTDGTLWVWGRGYGLNTNSNFSSPVQVGTLSNWAQVGQSRLSNQFSVAINSSGDLYIAGQATTGGLGVENISQTNAFFTLSATANTQRIWSQAACGYQFTAAITSDGNLWTWGRNTDGQLGILGRTAVFSPIQILPFDTWKKVVTGTWHTVALNSNGTLSVWGVNNQGGQLGLNTNAGPYSSPVLLDSDSIWSDVATGAYSSYAINTNGALWAWGNNNIGQLGLGNTTDRSSPVQVGSLSNWSKITAHIVNFNAAISIKTDGTLWAWGYNAFGQLGLSNLTNRSSPVQVGNLSNWSQVSAGGAHALAIKTDGTLWGWGNGGNGQLGNFGVNVSSPVQIGALSNWSQVSCGYSHTLAIKTDGTIWAWGRNVFGELGLNTTASVSSPVQIGTQSDWSKITCGYYSSRAIKTDGTLWTWGYNPNGQLGLSDITNRSSPVQVGTDTNWNDLVFNGQGSGAIKTSGVLYMWGHNNGAQLGVWDSVDRSSPVVVGAPISYAWKQVACGYQNTAALNSNGTLWTWGINNQGQLGLNNTTSRYSPVQVGTLSNWSQISNGVNYSVALNSLGQIYGWGANARGTLGLFSSFTYPVQKSTTDRNYTGVVTNKDVTLFTRTNQIGVTIAWALGNNSFGAIGLNTNTPYFFAPVGLGFGWINNPSKIDTKNYSTIALPK